MSAVPAPPRRRLRRPWSDARSRRGYLDIHMKAVESRLRDRRRGGARGPSVLAGRHIRPAAHRTLWRRGGLGCGFAEGEVTTDDGRRRVSRSAASPTKPSTGEVLSTAESEVAQIRPARRTRRHAAEAPRRWPRVGAGGVGELLRATLRRVARLRPSSSSGWRDARKVAPGNIARRGVAGAPPRTWRFEPDPSIAGRPWRARSRRRRLVALRAVLPQGPTTVHLLENRRRADGPAAPCRIHGSRFGARRGAS